jgi:16S rRNA (cytosine967-C5)-methyltransferase
MAFNMVRFSRTIDFLLPIACNNSSLTFYMLSNEERFLARYAIGLMVCEDINSYDIALAGFPESVARLVLGLGDAQPILESQEPALKRLAIQASLPDWLVEKVCLQYGFDEGQKILLAMNKRAPLCVRTNTLKTDADALKAALSEENVAVERGAYSPWALKLKSRINVRGLKAFREGLFETQDEGSQLIAEMTGVGPECRVIDFCAGTGGKTLALGAMMKGTGAILATDVRIERLDRMRPRLKRAGLRSVTHHCLEAALPVEWTSGVDCVLVDAPCTGSGTFRRSPERKNTIREEELDERTRTQIQVLEEASRLVSKGGRLVYATCSILAEENEEIIHRFQAQCPGFELVPLEKTLGEERGTTLGNGTFLKMLPHLHDTDGFFCAVLERRA